MSGRAEEEGGNSREASSTGVGGSVLRKVGVGGISVTGESGTEVSGSTCELVTKTNENDKQSSSFTFHRSIRRRPTCLRSRRFCRRRRNGFRWVGVRRTQLDGGSVLLGRIRRDEGRRTRGVWLSEGARLCFLRIGGLRGLAVRASQGRGTLGLGPSPLDGRRCPPGCRWQISGEEFRGRDESVRLRFCPN
jgi:hypothetical protein